MNVLNTLPKLIKRTMIFSGLAMLLLLQGCFHRDDPAPVPDADATGYYTGTLSGGVSDSTSVHALINGNHMMLMSVNSGILYDGTMAITGNSFTSTATIYSAGTATGATTAISGTITAGSQITGDLAGSGIGSGSFTLTYATSNSETAAVSRITTSGSQYWTELLFDVPTAWSSFLVSLPNSLVNDSEPLAGIFTACAISSGATITPISGTNLYSVSLTFELCTPTSAANVSYTGIATAFSTSVTDDTIIMAVTGVGFASSGKFEKFIP